MKDDSGGEPGSFRKAVGFRGGARNFACASGLNYSKPDSSGRKTQFQRSIGSSYSSPKVERCTVWNPSLEGRCVIPVSIPAQQWNGLAQRHVAGLESVRRGGAAAQVVRRREQEDRRRERLRDDGLHIWHNVPMRGEESG